MTGALRGDLMLEATDIVHAYGAVVAVDHVSITTRRGEFLTILGESGSGKTTMLRIISGLESPKSAGKLAIGGRDVLGVPAAQRDCTTVFQSYALFPHMSVAENVSYGLKLRRVPRPEATQRTMAALDMMRLMGKGDRRIAQLSGGERQRVALARALVTRPAILLLDEPLGALDERLRLDMQAELLDIHRSLGTTFIYITHSQEEALTMSDRIVLMRRGRVEQSGTPESLFDRPASRFAATFMGFENILEGRVVNPPAAGRIDVEVAGARLQGAWLDESAPKPGAAVAVAIRAERLTLGAGTHPDRNTLACSPSGELYRGKYTDVSAETAAGPIRIRSWDRGSHRGDFQAVSFQPDDCIVLAQ